MVGAMGDTNSDTKDRLTRSDWLAHGLRTLARHGANALKVGDLAAGLEVSRGSFYWHFRDATDFRLQLLQLWQERATDQVFREIDAAIVGPARLTHLMKLAFNEDRSLDRAIRELAATDPTAAEMVASVDARRIDYLSKLMIESGVESRRALPRAEFLYWAYIGQTAVLNPAHTVVTELDIDDLSALFTRTDP
jgi:AcrR family transcriptional regulator